MLSASASSRRRTRSSGQTLAQGPLLLFIALLSLALAVALAGVSPLMGIGLVAGIVIFIICFVNTEASIYVLIFSMLLSPEFIVGGLGGASQTTASRGVTLRTEDLLLLVLAFAWLARMAVHKDLGLVRETPLNQPIARYVAICLVATAAGLAMGYVKGATGFFFVLKYVEYFVVYFVAANYINERRQIKRYTVALLVTAFIVSLVAMAQIPSGVRVSAPFEGERGEPNTLGGYLLFVGALAAGLAFHLERRSYRWLLIALIGAMLVPFLATLSRSSYAGLPIVYLALVVLYKKHRMVMIGALLVVGLIAMAMVPQVVKDRVLYTFNQEATRQERVAIGAVKLDTSTSERIKSWQGALEAMGKSPIWGFGVTGYGFLDAQYPRVLVETGLAGLGLFLALIYAVFKETMKVFRATGDPLYRGLGMGLLAGLAGLMIHGLGSNTFIIVRIMEPFWLMVGMVVSVSRMEQPAPAASA